MKTAEIKDWFFVLFAILILGCQPSDSDYLFKTVSYSGIEFSNDLNYTQELNPYTYRNYYNGAGIGVADFDNDGLEDLYFSGNQVDNTIYKNLGGFQFEEIQISPVLKSKDSWSTGVSIVDINQDGLKDIYVCKAGPPDGPNRYNELFINQGDFKFIESAEKYGLKIKGFSIHASFFDFDRDGDLDCYLLNNSLRSVGGYDLRPGLRLQDSDEGNMLLVNENGVYVNRSKELGIYTSDIGFGLGVNTSDFNGDGWIDIYVANDFFEKDYYYLNQGGKEFVEVGESYFNSFSLGSMGVDAADIDNDGDLDILAAEMAPATLERKKTKATYESWDKYQKAVKSGYSHQMPRNMLHMNDGAYYSEISRMNGLDATEWSWAPLIFDMNNDGLQDVFISNGVGKDLLDRDYLSYMADEQRLRELMKNRDNESLKALIDIMPFQKVNNSFFIQKEPLRFSNETHSITDLGPTYSNASVISDLDNDGDLDIVISNIDDKVAVLENRSIGNFVRIKLIGSKMNPDAIGAHLEIKLEGKSMYASNNPYRGFQSSISTIQNIGIGSVEYIEEIIVTWPDQTKEKFSDIRINDLNILQMSKGFIHDDQSVLQSERILVTEVDSFDYQYPVRQFNEFNKEKLLLSMLPSESPVISPQIDEDGNLYILSGGSQNFPVEKNCLSMNCTDTLSFLKSFRSVTTQILPFDSDNDGDLDVYMAHGSRVFSPYSFELDDVLYVNNGDGNYTLSQDAFQFDDRLVTGAVASGDLNNDGLEDIVIGERIRNDVYGLPSRLYYYLNKGENRFELSDVEEGGIQLGMITDIIIDNLDEEESLEIIVAGEWMGIRVYNLIDGKLVDVSERFNLSEFKGIWRDIHTVDIDGDGDLDVIGANQGLNSYVQSNTKLYVSDFDGNGREEQIHTQSIKGRDYPILDYDEITSQLPHLRSVVPNYSSYAKASMSDLFDENIINETLIRELTELRSGLFINNNQKFHFVPFPDVVQRSSMHAIETDDVNGDGAVDVFMGGNHYLYKPQFGRDDASHGHLITGRMNENGYEFLDDFSLNIKGEIRTIQKMSSNEYLIGVNSKKLIKYRVEYE